MIYNIVQKYHFFSKKHICFLFFDKKIYICKYESCFHWLTQTSYHPRNKYITIPKKT